MTKSRTLTLALIAIGMSFLMLTDTMAKQGNSDNKGHGKQAVTVIEGDGITIKTKSGKIGIETIDNSFSRPPGWDRGQKTGWGDLDVPPGLAKKEAEATIPVFAPVRDFFRTLFGFDRAKKAKD